MDKYLNTYCKYCKGESILNCAEVLQCSSCEQLVHVSCLKRQSVPGGLFGDTFYNFICQECSTTGVEVFTREKMTWFQIIILIMFHIHNKAAGTANKGFYHWRIHVVSLIDKHWNILFPKDIKRRKNWMGTISGAISNFSPCFFTSGTSTLGSNGWWKLTFSGLTPTTCIILYHELTAKKGVSLKTYDDIVHIKKFIRKFVPALAFEEFRGNDIIYYEDTEIDVEDEVQSTIFDDESKALLQHNLQINQLLKYITPLGNISKLNEKESRQKSDYAITSTSFKHSDTNFYTFWKNQRKSRKTEVSSIVPLRIMEEEMLHNYMLSTKLKNRSEISLNRKLHVRSLKRKYGMKTFGENGIPQDTLSRIRSRHYTKCYEDEYLPHLSKIMAHGKIRMTESFISPYTNRLLKPFIRRNEKPNSLWLKLMSELIQKVGEKQKTPIDWKISTLDYVYVQPNHIPTINSLCEQYFWPGINLSETLEYPEFSCVVLYKKLIVAFGFMVPDVKFNETYISFIFTRPEWRCGGIATFMIYHLIQTCMGKDVTLHVAIDNPAIHLYQKFGFKVEKVVYNFYDTFLRDDSKKRICMNTFVRPNPNCYKNVLMFQSISVHFYPKPKSQD